MSIAIEALDVIVPGTDNFGEPVRLTVSATGLQVGGSGEVFWWPPKEVHGWMQTHFPQLADAPFFAAVRRYLVEQYVAHRRNPIGAFLLPCVEALDAFEAKRHGSSVYFAACGQRVKIGWSTKVTTRIAQLQTGSPEPIRLLGTTPGGLKLERQLHQQFAGARVHGEWFDLTPELRQHIEATVGGGP